MKREQTLLKIYENNNFITKDAEISAIATLEFQQLMMMYEAAIKEITTKLEILNCEFHSGSCRNPIESVKSRIKTPLSIRDKLRRRGYPVTLDSMRHNIQDIAGVRVTCPFISDIYDVAAMLLSQEDVTLVTMKDYIETPKENGYRSLHLVVSTPVFLSNRREEMEVEIQIRTIAMDFWASLEHEINYKKKQKLSPALLAELKECADIIAETDRKMEKIAGTVPGKLRGKQLFPAKSRNCSPQPQRERSL